MIERLDAANYPVRDVEVTEFGDQSAEIVVTLVSTAVEPSELDAVADKIETERGVTHAGWSASADA